MLYRLELKKSRTPGLILEYEGPDRQVALDGFSFYSDPDNGYIGAHVSQVFSKDDIIVLRTTNSPDGKGDCIF